MDLQNVELLGDCLELAGNIPAGSIDLVLTDLPYGVTQHPFDVALPPAELWPVIWRVLKPDGLAVLFAQGAFSSDLIQSQRRNFRYSLVWDKELISGHLNANRMPLRRHEDILVFYKKLGTYNPIYTQGQPLHGKGVDVGQWKNNNYGKIKPIPDYRRGSTEKYPVSILKFRKPVAATARHRTEKPVELLEYLIKTYTNPGETVLDLTAGCGGVKEAALNTDRGFIVIEKDPDEFIKIQARTRTRGTVHGQLKINFEL